MCCPTRACRVLRGLRRGRAAAGCCCLVACCGFGAVVAGCGCWWVPFGGAELACDLGAFEPAAQSGVGDLVVGGECSQRLPGGAAAHEFGVGAEAAQPRPVGLGGGFGFGVVVEGAHQQRRVDQAEQVLAAAQPGRLQERLDAATRGHDRGGGAVGPAVQVGAAEWLAQVVLVQPVRVAASGGGPGAAAGSDPRRDRSVVARLRPLCPSLPRDRAWLWRLQKAESQGAGASSRTMIRLPSIRTIASQGTIACGF